MLTSDQGDATVPTGRSFALPAAAAVCSAPPLPDGPCPVCPRLASEFEPYRLAGYWKSTHERALVREADLKAEAESLRALLLLREQQLFGTKSEAGAAGSEASPSAKPSKPRGQQPGQPGPKRRGHSRLPATQEIVDLPDGQRHCSGRGLPFVPFAGTEDGEALEVEVKAYRRVYRRRRYRPACGCGRHPGVVAAPPPAKLIPKSILGVSIWVEVPLDKYLFYRPTYRLLEDWKAHGLDLSLGTLTDGLRRLVPLSEPVYRALAEHNQKQAHWHADETRWLVFATVEGKVGHRWTLWVFHSEEAVVFVLDQGRAHDVPEDHLGPVEEGILSVDRYSAYKAMKQVKDGGVLLAFCWAHVRRDFLGVARSWPKQEEWALGWVERIGLLYQANDAPPNAARARGVRREGRTPATGCRGDGPAGGNGTGRSGDSPGAGEGADEPARALGGADGVRGAPGSADGQQHGGACPARPGGVAEEQLWLGSGVGGRTGGHALQRVPDTVPVEHRPARVAGRVPARVR
jgi:transposase